MVIIDNLLINSSYYEILISFRAYLSSKGVNFLKEIKEGQDNIMVTCPFHKNGQENKPSSGISTKDGVFHCFTCGTVRTFAEVLSYCLGYLNDNGQAGKKWIIDNIANTQIEQRELSFKLSRDIAKKSYISEEELDSYRYYHPYMFQRKLTEKIIDKFDVGYDIKTNSITFPVRDINGNVLFIARRRVDYKYFNYPSGVEKPLYGIYELSKNAKHVIICESIFNALTCYVYGKEAIALNGTGSKEQLEELLKLGVRTIYLGLDNDDAGNKGTEKIYKKLKGHFLLYRMIFPIGKDINDLTKEEFDNIFYNAVKMS